MLIGDDSFPQPFPPRQLLRVPFHPVSSCFKAFVAAISPGNLDGIGNQIQQAVESSDRLIVSIQSRIHRCEQGEVAQVIAQKPV